MRRLTGTVAAAGFVVLVGIVSCGGTSSTTTSGPDATTTQPATSSTVPSTTSSTTTSAAPSTTTTSSTTTSAAPSTTTTLPATQVVIVYFSSGDGSDCAMVSPFEREVSADTSPIRAAFDALVGGPTDAEIAAGAGSFFTAETASAVRSVRLEGSALVVDFFDVRSQLNNASTSCGSEALLGQLTATAFQFPEVGQVTFEIDGSCATFFNWLQRECIEYFRD